MNMGLVWLLKSEKVMILRHFFWRTSILLRIRSEVSPQILQPHIRSRTSEIYGWETRGKREKNLRPMHRFCYISGNKEAFLLLIFCKSWRIYLAIVFSSCHFHTWNNSAGNGEIPQRHLKIENLVYDKKNTIIQERSTRTKNVSIEMIMMKASKMIIIRLSYCFVFLCKKMPFLGQNGPKIAFSSNNSSETHRNYWKPYINRFLRSIIPHWCSFHELILNWYSATTQKSLFWGHFMDISS